MNIVEIAGRHPELLRNILVKSTGAIGEILVAEKLNELGYRVEPTNNNARQRDLIATSPNGVRFGVEVKTGATKRPTWWVRLRPDADLSAIWVMIAAPRKMTELPDPDKVEMFVFSTEEIQTIWDASEYNGKNPGNGDIRRWQLPEDSIDAWDKLPK